MSSVRVVVATLALAFAAGCSSEIGDACAIDSDCNAGVSELNRSCDQGGGGYCTIRGCDFDTCPSEATCVGFFTGSFANRTCNPDTEDQGTDDCSADELCGLNGHCVTRSSEIRYCMRSCESNDDCRDGFECRDLTLMKEHGGQPVLDPDPMSTDTNPDKHRFCALAPS